MDMTVETPLTLAQVDYCVNQASLAYPNVSPLMLKTLLAVEGGQVGTVSKNSNKTYDLGPMQINTIHLREIAKVHGFGVKDVVFNACRNIKVGAWLLSRHVTETGGKHWLAMGRYHSKTPKYRNRYVRKAADAYLRIISARADGTEAKALGRVTNWGKGPQKTQASRSLLPDLLKETRPARPTGRLAPDPQVHEINNKRKTLRFID